MRLRNIPWAKGAIETDSRCFCNAKEAKRGWKAIFGSDAPLHVEIGMGKGQFLVEMALRYSWINFIGIERYESVMIRALQKLDQMASPPENIRLLRADAAQITDYFPRRSIDKIYLNFSRSNAKFPSYRHAAPA